VPKLSFNLFSSNAHSSKQNLSYYHSLLDLTVGRFDGKKWFSSRKQRPIVNLPIGYDNFRDVIDQKFTFVDKSLLIKEFLDDNGTQVALITRPRRFGKTLNLSMLHHFFAAEVHGKPTKGLFDKLKITQQGQQYMQHQGKYPVVALSFKDIKQNSFKDAFEKFSELFVNTYDEHNYLLNSEKITDTQKRFFESILKQETSQPQLENALRFLTECLFKYHDGVKPLLLIDEYDTPIQSGYSNKHYDQIVGLMRGLFSAGLKSNPYLYRAMLTGILRVSKESLFSGLNNLKVYSVLNSKYSEHFGFTEAEVNSLFTQTNLKNDPEQIKEWYNAYKIGGTVIYNPWSIVNCIQEQGVLKPYWVNTSDNTLVKDLLIQSSTQFKHKFELLLEGKVVEQFIDENFVFTELKGNEAAVWSLLLMTGYLKAVFSKETEQGTLCQLQVPNQEIRNLYRKIIEQWLSNGKGVQWYNEFLNYLLTGNVEGFKASLGDIMMQTISVYDIAREPEAFYQGLMIGLTASLDKSDYEKKSNRESGYGRYDIAIIPRDTNKLAIILELKSVTPPKKEKNLAPMLRQEAKEALTQIDHNKYTAELKQRGIRNVLKIGLAFSGKEFYVEAKRELANLEIRNNPI
jgi:Predicted AAA-ATPase/PD-(D/E)XK nuclease superfamily